MTESGDARGLAWRREIAAQAMDPCVTSSAVVATFWDATEEGIDPQLGYEAMRAQVQQVSAGVLSSAEAMLVGHAAALNAIFVDMARRAHASLDRPGQAAERYMRLALRAQMQCRMTIEDLTALAARPQKKIEQKEQITHIVRQIVYPKHPYGEDDVRAEEREPTDAPCPAADPYNEADTLPDRDATDGETGGKAGAVRATSGNDWEAWTYGARLDGGTARGAVAEDAGGQAVGALHRTAYG